MTAVDPILGAYLTTNREFMAPAVRSAVRLLRVDAGARVLDAGTGAGGGLVELGRAAGANGTVSAIDLHPGVVDLAGQFVKENEVPAQVDLRQGDLLEVVEEVRGSAEEGFDVIWASDLIWPGNFADPADVVRRMAQALRPGGVIGLFYSNYYQSMFLPGRSRLERALKAASEARWGLPTSGPDHYERHIDWLRQAGLSSVGLDIIPRVAHTIDEDPAARAYLESAVWPELLSSAEAKGREVGMSDDDLAEARALLDPDSPRYVLNDPAHYVVHPALLATGRR